MSYLLSYQSGVVGYGLSNNFDEAMSEAEERCTEMQQSATIINRSTYAVLAEVSLTSEGYKASKKE